MKKTTIEAFEKRVHLLSEKDIVELSNHSNGIFNVIKGFHRESFDLGCWDHSVNNFDYFVIYTTKVNEKLIGYILKLQPHLQIRNELVACFVNFIIKEFKTLTSKSSIFNTFQDQQRSLFERLDYWTYDESLKKEIKGKNFELFLKDYKGVLYVPFINDIPDNLNEEKCKSKTINYVYIMHNRKTEFYKIGRSNNPQYREKTLQSEEPDVILIQKWIAPSAIEKVLHTKFKHKRTRGEWFTLTEIDIEEIRSFMLQYSSH